MINYAMLCYAMLARSIHNHSHSYEHAKAGGPATRSTGGREGDGAREIVGAAARHGRSRGTAHGWQCAKDVSRQNLA